MDEPQPLSPLRPLGPHDPLDGDEPDLDEPPRLSPLASFFDLTGVTERTLLAGLAALALVAGAVWWALSRPAEPLEATMPLVEPELVTTTSALPADVVVHVAGAVNRPGVVVLSPDARVKDAVDAAGGAVAGADLARVNLAAELVDGSQIYVPLVGEDPPGPVDGGQGLDAPGGLVDVNTADAAALETLPGIGPATAAAIIEHRQTHGPFTAVEGLLDVNGIGEAKLAALVDLVQV